MIDLIVSIIIGICADAIAGKLTNQGGNGCLINLLLGVVGGFVGGWLFGILGINMGGTPSWLGALITATVGAALVLWIWRKLRKLISGVKKIRS